MNTRLHVKPFVPACGSPVSHRLDAQASDLASSCCHQLCRRDGAHAALDGRWFCDMHIALYSTWEECACGCGEMKLVRFDPFTGEKKLFIKGHNRGKVSE